MEYLRTKVSGKKHRFIDEKYNLDLSYITNRIIAMAFPASGLGKLYRNSIDSVSSFLVERHTQHYWVINLSGKSYDYKKFDNRVSEYDWVDHHAPPLKILFEICREIMLFLNKNLENIVAINCMAGKGRTGTIICCFLMYSGLFSQAELALEYYSKKRFSSGEGVTQPSQKRYVYYFERLLIESIKFPNVIKITDISINKLLLNFSNGFKPFIEIYQDNGSKLTYSNKLSYSEQKKIFTNNAKMISLIDKELDYFCGDITIKLFINKLLTVKKIGRTAFNSAFIDNNKEELIFKLHEIDPDSLVKNKNYPKEFEIHIKFKRICNCDNMGIETCEECRKYNFKELKDWKEIRSIIDSFKFSSKEETNKILFGDETDDIETVFKNGLTYHLSKIKDDTRTMSLPSNHKSDLNNSFEKDCVIF